MENSIGWTLALTVYVKARPELLRKPTAVRTNKGVLINFSCRLLLMQSSTQLDLYPTSVFFGFQLCDSHLKKFLVSADIFVGCVSPSHLRRSHSGKLKGKKKSVLCSWILLLRVVSETAHLGRDLQLLSAIKQSDFNIPRQGQ